MYRPNPSAPATAGVNSTWMQQYCRLSTKDRTTNPRDILITDLLTDIHTEQKIHSDIIVVGDFNEDIRDSDEQGLKRLLRDGELYQVFQELKSFLPSTRGNNRAIDHILASCTVLPYVSQLGIVPEDVCFASDHIGLFMDISPKILDTVNLPIPPHPHRKLKMYNTPNVHKYTKEVLYQMQCHNIFSRIDKLDDHIKHHGFDILASGDLERIDQQVTSVMLKAEEGLVPSDTKYALSVDLLHQMRKIRLIKTLQNQHEKKYPLESYVNQDVEEEALQLINKTADEQNDILESERDKLIQMQDDSWDIREDHHNDQINAAAIAENKSVAVKIKEMKEREK